MSVSLCRTCGAIDGDHLGSCDLVSHRYPAVDGEVLVPVGKPADIGSAEPVGVDFDPPAQPSKVTKGMREVSPGVWARDAQPVREVQVGHIDDPAKDWPTEPISWPDGAAPLILEKTFPETPEPSMPPDVLRRISPAYKTETPGEVQDDRLTMLEIVVEKAYWDFKAAATGLDCCSERDAFKGVLRKQLRAHTQRVQAQADHPDECAHGNPAADECAACDAYAADMAAMADYASSDADDPINPDHYNQGEIECIDALRSALTPEQFQGFCRGNAIKYLWRLGLKGSAIEQLDKTEWYLTKLRQELEDEIP